MLKLPVLIVMGLVLFLAFVGAIGVFVIIREAIDYYKSEKDWKDEK